MKIKNTLMIFVILTNFIHAEMIRDDDGIVTDLKTNLEWDDTDNKIRRIWSDAIKYCEESTLGGHNDWRLPNINELMSITNYDKDKRVWDAVFQKNVVPNKYWTSTTIHKSSRDAWSIDFSNGRTYNLTKYSLYRQRCVRTK